MSKHSDPNHRADVSTDIPPDVSLPKATQVYHSFDSLLRSMYEDPAADPIDEDLAGGLQVSRPESQDVTEVTAKKEQSTPIKSLKRVGKSIARPERTLEEWSDTLFDAFFYDAFSERTATIEELATNDSISRIGIIRCGDEPVIGSCYSVIEIDSGKVLVQGETLKSHDYSNRYVFANGTAVHDDSGLVFRLHGEYLNISQYTSQNVAQFTIKQGKGLQAELSTQLKSLQGETVEITFSGANKSQTTVFAGRLEGFHSTNTDHIVLWADNGRVASLKQGSFTINRLTPCVDIPQQVEHLLHNGGWYAYEELAEMAHSENDSSPHTFINRQSGEIFTGSLSEFQAAYEDSSTSLDQIYCRQILTRRLTGGVRKQDEVIRFKPQDEEYSENVLRLEENYRNSKIVASVESAEGAKYEGLYKGNHKDSEGNSYLWLSGGLILPLSDVEVSIQVRGRKNRQSSPDHKERIDTRTRSELLRGIGQRAGAIYSESGFVHRGGVVAKRQEYSVLEPDTGYASHELGKYQGYSIAQGYRFSQLGGYLDDSRGLILRRLRYDRDKEPASYDLKVIKSFCIHYDEDAQTSRSEQSLKSIQNTLVRVQLESEERAFVGEVIGNHEDRDGHTVLWLKDGRYITCEDSSTRVEICEISKSSVRTTLVEIASKVPGTLITQGRKDPNLTVADGLFTIVDLVDGRVLSQSDMLRELSSGELFLSRKGIALHSDRDYALVPHLKKPHYGDKITLSPALLDPANTSEIIDTLEKVQKDAVHVVVNEKFQRITHGKILGAHVHHGTAHIWFEHGVLYRVTEPCALLAHEESFAHDVTVKEDVGNSSDLPKAPTEDRKKSEIVEKDSAPKPPSRPRSKPKVALMKREQKVRYVEPAPKPEKVEEKPLTVADNVLKLTEQCGGTAYLDRDVIGPLIKDGTRVTAVYINDGFVINFSDTLERRADGYFGLQNYKRKIQFDRGVAVIPHGTLRDVSSIQTGIDEHQIVLDPYDSETMQHAIAEIAPENLYVIRDSSKILGIGKIFGTHESDGRTCLWLDTGRIVMVFEAVTLERCESLIPATSHVPTLASTEPLHERLKQFAKQTSGTVYLDNKQIGPDIAPDTKVTGIYLDGYVFTFSDFVRSTVGENRSVALTKYPHSLQPERGFALIPHQASKDLHTLQTLPTPLTLLDPENPAGIDESLRNINPDQQYMIRDAASKLIGVGKVLGYHWSDEKAAIWLSSGKIVMVFTPIICIPCYEIIEGAYQRPAPLPARSTKPDKRQSGTKQNGGNGMQRVNNVPAPHYVEPAVDSRSLDSEERQSPPESTKSVFDDLQVPAVRGESRKANSNERKKLTVQTRRQVQVRKSEGKRSTQISLKDLVRKRSKANITVSSRRYHPGKTVSGRAMTEPGLMPFYGEITGKTYFTDGQLKLEGGLYEGGRYEVYDNRTGLSSKPLYKGRFERLASVGGDPVAVFENDFVLSLTDLNKYPEGLSFRSIS